MEVPESEGRMNATLLLVIRFALSFITTVKIRKTYRRRTLITIVCLLLRSHCWCFYCFGCIFIVVAVVVFILKLSNFGRFQSENPEDKEEAFHPRNSQVIFPVIRFKSEWLTKWMSDEAAGKCNKWLRGKGYEGKNNKFLTKKNIILYKQFREL